MTYLGSGKYWKKHLATHGEDVSTLWCCLYDDENLLKEEAMSFSLSHNIVESQEWANLVNENGVDGAPPGVDRSGSANGMFGKTHSTETIQKFKGPKTDEHRKKMSAAAKGKPHLWQVGKPGRRTGHTNTPEHNAIISAARSGPQPKVCCPHCGKSGGQALMTRWHFNNCRLK